MWIVGGDDEGAEIHKMKPIQLIVNKKHFGCYRTEICFFEHLRFYYVNCRGGRGIGTSFEWGKNHKIDYEE